MRRDPSQVFTTTLERIGPGPYRRRPPADPELDARLDEALDAARSEMRSARRAHRWSTRLAASGYIAAALLTNPLGGDGTDPRALVWPSIAAGATCALVRATRAGSRTHDLEAEIADLERLSTALARTPG
jgi:hypothetical protein